MPITTCFVLGAAIVLFCAGVAKLGSPSSTVVAMRTLGIPAGPAIVTAMSVVEMCIAVAVVLWGAWPSLLILGLAYLGFAAFTALTLTRLGHAGSCGCFGAHHTPVHLVHVIVNVIVGLVAVVSATDPPRSIDAIIRAHPDLAGALVVTAVVVGLAIAVCLTVIPELLVGINAVRHQTR